MSSAWHDWRSGAWRLWVPLSVAWLATAPVLADEASAVEPAPSAEVPEVDVAPSGPAPAAGAGTGEGQAEPPTTEGEPAAGEDEPAPARPPGFWDDINAARPRRSWKEDLSGSRRTDAPPPPAPAAGTPPGATDRPAIELKLKNGQTVMGRLVAESPEGFTVTLPTGETRFYDRLDVAEDTAPKKSRPGWLRKALLLCSLAWPGAGQIIYAVVALDGPIWKRTALWVGSALAAVAVVAVAVTVAGVVIGFLLPQVAPDIPLAGPINPLTLAGVGGLVLAASVSLLDAGARAVLD